MSKTDLGKVSITPKGEYKESVIYERLDTITYEGSSYMVLKSIKGVTPIPDGINYQLMAKAGDSILTIRTIDSIGSTDLKSFKTKQIEKYAMIGKQTPWYDTEIPAEDIAKMVVGSWVRLMVHDSDRNKDLYLLGIVRVVNAKNCSIEGAGAYDGLPASRISVIPLTTDKVMLVDNTIYRAKVLTSVNFDLPKITDMDTFDSELDLTIGATPMTVQAPLGIDWQGDDTESGTWVPVESKRYVLRVHWDGVRYRVTSQSQKTGG